MTENQNNKPLVSSLQSAPTRRINMNTHINTRLRLTALAAVFAFLTPTTSTMHAQVLGATEGNKLQAARLLGITRRALRLRLRELGLAVMTSGARDEDDAIAPG